MDDTDIRLLEILQLDGRITLSDLSKKLALSRPSVTERLNRLLEKGVIEGISARVSPAGVGRTILLFMQISEVRVPYHEFEKMVSECPDILECHRVTGAISYILKAAVNNMDHLRALVDLFIPCGTINTSIVLTSPLSNRCLLPTESK